MTTTKLRPDQREHSIEETIAAAALLNAAAGGSYPRPLRVIAAEITLDWKRYYFGAEPYLRALRQLDWMTDKFYEDSAYEIVLYFLSNAARWRSPTARRIKAELNGRLKASV